MGIKFKRLLKVLHNFTDNVIRERKEECKARLENSSGKDTDDLGLKKKQAFLDLLISASDDGRNLSDRDIREEVDTFMFEGISIYKKNVLNTFIPSQVTTLQRPTCPSPCT